MTDAPDKTPKQKKAPRPKAETPKGFRDYFGAEVTERTKMLAKIAEVYHRYGFDALETSAVETVEALGKFLPDVDRPNAGVFAWQEASESEKPGSGNSGDWLALRYDMTAPLARVYAQYRNELPTPYRRYTMGPVWRNEKPGPGRFRQFYQCDADTVGTGSVAADAEICAMLADVLEAVGIERGDYVVKINNRKVLNGVMEAAGLFDPADPSKFEVERGIVLRAIDKKERLGELGVRALLGEGRKDESGDFSSGAKLSEEKIEFLMLFVNANSNASLLLSGEAENIAEFSPRSATLLYAAADENPPNTRGLGGLGNPGRERRNRALLDYLLTVSGGNLTGREGVAELRQIADLLAAQGYGPDRVIIDPSVVRGLGYYTGPVYEAELTFEIEDDKGRPQRFGSVAGGGRYDDLVKRFTGQAVPATGVSVGVDRLLAALRARRGEVAPAAGPVVVTVMDRERMADYQAMASDLRQALVDPAHPSKGYIRAEVYLGNPKNFGNQMKYADRRGSPVAIIAGGDEFGAGTVQIKDLILGAEIARNASLEEWKDRPSQYEVPRGDLVTRVQAILNGQVA